MPYHGPPLPPQQIALLRRWIKEGAKWEDHWAFVPPKPQPLPAVKQAGWVRQPLDRFILARLEKEGLQPSPEATRQLCCGGCRWTLRDCRPHPRNRRRIWRIRRPTHMKNKWIVCWLRRRYGERWAALWLDLARYADTKGYEADRERPGVWPYRDWVIDAFNRNLPYDSS